MPITHITFLIACLAIAGVPPLAGFFSKEEILLTAWNSNKLVYVLALLTSGLTAFYMFRLYFSIFWNKETHLHNTHGEGTFSMKLPLILLAILTVGVGFIPFGELVSLTGKPLHGHFSLQFSLAPIGVGLAGIIMAAWMYRKENEKPQQVATALSGVYLAAYRKFYIDELYLFVTKKILFNLVGRPAAWIDKYVVDGLMNGLAQVTGAVSRLIKGMQSGSVQSYALYFFGGVLLLAALFLYWWN
jgi:NADH-quinone oxidoreductase subunit L